MAWGTTVIWQLSATVHIIFFILEMSLQLYSSLAYITATDSPGGGGEGEDPQPQTIGYILTAFFGTSSTLTNILSIFWIFRRMDFSGQKSGIIICALLHLLQLGPLWRYFKILLIGDRCDIEELYLLRLIQTSVHNPIFIIIQVCMLMYFPNNVQKCLPAGVAISLLSMAFAYFCCSHTLNNSFSFVEHFKSGDPVGLKCSRKVSSAVRIFSRIFKHIFMLLSRLLAMILLAHVWRTWIFALILAHVICYSISSCIWKRILGEKIIPREGSRIKELSEYLAYGYVEIFDYVGIPSRSIKYVFTYYVIILIQNTLMSVVWYFSNDRRMYNDALLVLVFTFYILGAIACVFCEGVLCNPTNIPLREDKEIRNEENNNKNHNIKQEQLFSPRNQSLKKFQLNLKHEPNELSPRTLEQVDFELDLGEILMASSVFNPKPVDDGEISVISCEIRKSPDKQEQTELPQDVQTSSESGFVSKLLDNSLSFEHDSEGCEALDSCGCLTLGGSTENGPQQVHAQIETPLGHQSTYTHSDTQNISQNSFTHNAELVTQCQNDKDNTEQISKKDNKTSKETAAENPNEHQLNEMKSEFDNYGYESDFTSSTTECESENHDTRKRVKKYVKNRSMPNTRKVETGKSKIPAGKSSQTSETSTEGALPEGSNLSRCRREFFMGDTSSYSSESIFESYSSMTSTSWSDSQSLGDSEYGLALTWPPGRKCAILNIADLPMERMPSRERINQWLSGLNSEPKTEQLEEDTQTQVSRKPQLDPKVRQRFDTFRDININYVDIDREKCLSEMRYSNEGMYEGKMSRSFSDRGVGLIKRSSSFLQICGIGLSKKKKWINNKIIHNLTKKKRRTRRSIIVNREGTRPALPVIGMESAV